MCHTNPGLMLKKGQDGGPAKISNVIHGKLRISCSCDVLPGQGDCQFYWRVIQNTSKHVEEELLTPVRQ